MASNGHPLPPSPSAQQNVRPSQHRPKTSFSFRSTGSHKSSGSIPKIDLHESHEEKQAKRLNSKADPSMAMNEAEPSEVAKQENKLPSIRELQHFDKQGNPISDPDRSNPTRSRWERPLDTIRSFEEAIDGSYSRKSTHIRSGTESSDASQYTRQSSYFAGSTGEERPRQPSNGFQNGVGRSQSYADGRGNGMTRPGSYYQTDYNAGPSTAPGYYNPNRARYPRTSSEPHFNNGHVVYPAPGAQHSYETVTTASGSGSAPDTIGYSTDPSSENSSMDRIVSPAQYREPADNYGLEGFGGNPVIPPVYNVNQNYGSNLTQQYDYTNQGPPPVPRKEVSVSRAPIRLGGGGDSVTPSPSRPVQMEKRKSWFGKKAW
ncbi:hypothetical protein BJ878DRAFT_267360 [Calycina marina]|uniref:Uncharacterized protein n=1 Tax=Calycina marina TaxID=1763456 RepID=A0A9P8CGW4_9HELO|nr:hypothetical protein BJ878DRAFT_267360 [Calycina marina]